MGQWTKHRRETGLVEHICEHGTGHPAHGSALWLAEARCAVDPNLDLREQLSVELIHGCDGCCRDEDFPGTPIDSLIHAHAIIRNYQEALDMEPELRPDPLPRPYLEDLL